MQTPPGGESASLAASLIERADVLIIAAGAGMGVDSGLPDFRGKDGFWKAYPALARARVDFYSIASPQAFRSAPERAWGFYAHRLALYRRTTPHPGFALLKSWGEKMPHGYSVFTSNVDGQFQRAGFDDRRIVECHGSIHHLQCLDACASDIWSAERFVPDVDDEECRLRNAAPRCTRCGGVARPNILMFGDRDWIDSRERAQTLRQEAWLASLSAAGGNPVVVELGAGTTIPTVRHFSERVARRFGGRLVRINPDEPDVPARSDAALAMGALEGLTAIASALGPEWREHAAALHEQARTRGGPATAPSPR